MFRGRAGRRGIGRARGGGRGGARKQAQPTGVRGGRVSKQGRGDGTSSGIKIPVSGRGERLAQISNSMPSGSGSTSSTSAAQLAMPSSSRAHLESVSTVSHPSSTIAPSSASAKQPMGVQGGRVSKQGRGGRTSSGIKIPASGRGERLAQIANSMPSGSGSTSSTSAAQLAMPSSSRAHLESVSTVSHPSSTIAPSSASAKQPMGVRGGRVSKQGRGGRTSSGIKISASGRGGSLTRTGNSIPSGSGSASAAHSAVPSSSKACLDPVSTVSHSSSTMDPSSESATQQLPPDKNGVAAARAHLMMTSGVVTVPPIYNRTVKSRNLIRIKGDLTQLYKDPPSGIHVMQDDNDMTVIHVIITGPVDTPYEAGFFYFLVTCHADYPIQPPTVKFMTTGGGRVRFNPNLYRCGTVCLSVLGTWAGPSWQPSQTLSSLLVQIQTHVFNEQPYFNEPGVSKVVHEGELRKYNSFIQHETIRVAVIGMVNNDFGLSIPDELMGQIRKSFIAMYDIYEAKLIENLRLSGTGMIPFQNGNFVQFQHATLLTRLRDLKKKLSPQRGVPKPTPSCSGEPSWN